MYKVKLSNSFHGTECVILSHTDDMWDAWLDLQIMASEDRIGRGHRQKLARVRRLLCGADDCGCGIVR